ncbi:hypothetical protein EZV62_015893 [Acer yangbiense]|uniref:Uncharacterized protein n=1 Tax=Acer yangbiense TaxID=1000413 RepID=A0A5C7HMQ0_9ROSI|nr:hypothetical protein EZV62_015893 [Acer yangbiense]
MHPTSFSKDAEDKAGGGNGKEAVGNPKRDADKTTFWTYCPSCGIRYQYHRTHVNTLLLCQSCQQSFTAYDLGSLEISSAHPFNRSLNQNGVPNPVFQNRFPNPGPSKVPSQSIHGNSSAMAQEKVDGHMKGMEGVRMHKPDVENWKEGLGKPKPDGGKPSECGTSRNADKKKKRMPVGESNESYEAGNGDEDKDVVLAAQAHLYRIIKVARDRDLAEQIGRDIYFDLVDHDKVRSFRIQKQTPFIAFKEEVAKEFGIPVQFQRFWIWAKRQNHTYRPNRPLLPQEEAQTVGQLREVSNKKHNAELKLFLEVEIGPDLRFIPPPDKSKEDILLFFKLYDPEKAELRYVGRLFLESSSKPIEIIGKLNQMAGFDPDEEIELYEEIKFEPNVMCEHLDKRASFRISQIQDGDIICFQKISPLESEEDYRYPDVPSFLEYVRSDNAPKRAYSVNQNRHTFEKPFKKY